MAGPPPKAVTIFRGIRVLAVGNALENPSATPSPRSRPRRPSRSKSRRARPTCSRGPMRMQRCDSRLRSPRESMRSEPVEELTLAGGGTVAATPPPSRAADRTSDADVDGAGNRRAAGADKRQFNSSSAIKSSTRIARHSNATDNDRHSDRRLHRRERRRRHDARSAASWRARCAKGERRARRCRPDRTPQRRGYSSKRFEISTTSAKHVVDLARRRRGHARRAGRPVRRRCSRSRPRTSRRAPPRWRIRRDHRRRAAAVRRRGPAVRRARDAVLRRPRADALGRRRRAIDATPTCSASASPTNRIALISNTPQRKPADLARAKSSARSTAKVVAENPLLSDRNYAKSIAELQQIHRIASRRRRDVHAAALGRLARRAMRECRPALQRQIKRA